MHTPLLTEIETFSGGYVNTEYPTPESIVLEDVAHALSQVCRFGGHTQKFYSVAEHAVLVSRRMEELGFSREECLAGMHHDDSEAYLGDIPRPLKVHLGERYRALSDRMDRAIIAGLALPFPFEALHTSDIKDADNWALFVEARSLLRSRGMNWESSFEDWDIDARSEAEAEKDPPYWHGGQDPTTAEGEFLSRHYELI